MNQIGVSVRECCKHSSLVSNKMWNVNISSEMPMIVKVTFFYHHWSASRLPQASWFDGVLDSSHRSQIEIKMLQIVVCYVRIIFGCEFLGASLTPRPRYRWKEKYYHDFQLMKDKHTIELQKEIQEKYFSKIIRPYFYTLRSEMVVFVKKAIVFSLETGIAHDHDQLDLLYYICS